MIVVVGIGADGMAGLAPAARAELARATVVGVDDTTAGSVRTILSRPETRTCLLAAAPAAGLTL